MGKSLKRYVRECLNAGMSVEATWKLAEHERWHVPWNYVRKIARDWASEGGNHTDTRKAPNIPQDRL